MTSTYRPTSVRSVQPNGQTYADRLQPQFTVRLRTDTAPKSLNGNQTVNYASEVVINDVHPLQVGDLPVTDALSVRLRVSGSRESMGRLKSMLQALIQTIPQWNDEDVWLGFPPTTAPVNAID
jgi:hypothetical protein